MLPVKILHDNKEKQIALNLKHITSFSEIIHNQKKMTEIRMSNGDIWIVIDPPYDHWIPDMFSNESGY